MNKKTEKEAEVNKSLKEFWNEKGPMVINTYQEKLLLPEGELLSDDNVFSKCEFLILTANTIESAIVSRHFMEIMGKKNPLKIVADKQTYHFYHIDGHWIAHVIPQNIGAYTVHGSANAVSAALKRFTPKAIFSVGVGYGIDPASQKLGDVLVSQCIVSWGNLCKFRSGKIQLDRQEAPFVGDSIFAGCKSFLDVLDYPEKMSIGDFKWQNGSLLSGPAVISDYELKNQLEKAALDIGINNLIGGEMEASGVLAAIPTGSTFLVVKGISDWAINKNGWSFVNGQKDQGQIKDCVQAFACENAIKTVRFIMSQVYAASQIAEVKGNGQGIQNKGDSEMLQRAHDEITESIDPYSGLLQSATEDIYTKEEKRDIVTSSFEKAIHNCNMIQKNFAKYRPYFSETFCTEIEEQLENVRQKFRIYHNENDKEKLPQTNYAYITALLDLETVYIKKMEEEIRMRRRDN